MSERTTVDTTETIDTISFNRRLIATMPGTYALQVITRLIFLLGPIIPGLIAQAVFDTLSGEAPAALGVWGLIALYLAAEAARLGALLAETWVGNTFRYTSGARLRGSILAAILRRPGAQEQPVAPGDAVDRFDNDIMEVTDFPTWLPEIGGEALTALIALGIMLSIDWKITLCAFLPMLAVVGLYRVVWGRMLRYREASRSASGAAAAFLGEALGGIQAIQLADAAPDVAARFSALADARRRAAVRERVAQALIDGVNSQTVTLGTGLFLLLAGQRMAAGSFSVGDFALFVSYLGAVANFPLTLGTFLGDYQQQAVAIRRLAELVRPEPAQALLAPPAAPEPPSIGPLRQGQPLLELRDVTYRYPSSGRGVEGASLSLAAGSITIITGRVGSGKSTLLRAALGLLPRDSGQVLWRGAEADRLAPPQAAYTPQVPRLLSTTLRENVLLGLEQDEGALAQALWQAAVDADVAGFAQGLETQLGPRGVRLSGGQVQRVAAARMLIRRPELLVFDDLSSALDGPTEQALWERLTAEAGRSILAVSHRRAALARADQVVVLRDGRVAAIGTLAQLAGTCEELAHLT